MRVNLRDLDGTARDDAALDDAALDDAVLIERSLRVSECFAGLYDRHAVAVHRFAAARLGDEGADDVVAETFLNAFRTRARYDLTRTDARPWLMGIAIREISRRRKQERSRYRLLANTPGELPVDGPADLVAASVTAHAVRGVLAEALSRLKAADRDVLLLVAWADLSYQEVAEALDIPIGTVRSRLNRARRIVRAALGNDNPLLTAEEA
jgi:RNA polymerase sigma-70 factor, ECF subfamily